MAMVKKSITLTDQQDSWIKAKEIGLSEQSIQDILRDIKNGLGRNGL